MKPSELEPNNETIAALREKSAKYWKEAEEQTRLEIFQKAVAEVPAYSQFLKAHKVNPDKVKTSEDFVAIVPPMTKDNYLRAHSWEKLCETNSLAHKAITLTSTSGSTGKPFYFPRNNLLDHQASIYHQLFFNNSNIDPDKSTLAIVGFGMGVWIGGIITYDALKRVAQNEYTMSVISPGVNKNEIYASLKNVAPKYDQIILCGYPPFIKDVVDEADSFGIKWKQFPSVKIFFAAEAFSEDFRDYIIKKTGMKNAYCDTANIYGSADLGTMAIETPLTILIRRLALKNEGLYKRLFSNAHRFPTLVQYIPTFISFEAEKGSVYCTGDNVMPLIRYKIGDNGGKFSFDELEQAFSDEGLDLQKEIKKAGISDTICQLPFVYVYERDDFSTKLYGAIIYPEYVKYGLQNKQFEKYLTGRFKMTTEFDSSHDEFLEINIELRPGITESDWLQQEVSRSIEESLVEHSAEHKNNASTIPEKVQPHIVFWPYGDETHFKIGIKQKWVEKKK
jgi:phenylacetate-CoA ligase